MPVYPGANYRPIAIHAGNGAWARSNGPMHSHRGAVLHVNQSNGNLFNFISTNPGGTSCHFEVYKTGVIEQFIDTTFSSWCQTDGNDDWVSIETEGYDVEPLNPSQLAAIAGLYEWLHTVHGLPLQLAETPTGSGFGWHGMGGDAWGGHPGCPGNLRKPQRQTILDLITAPPDPEEIDMLIVTVDTTGDGKGDAQWVIGGPGGYCPLTAAIRDMLRAADVPIAPATPVVSFADHTAMVARTPAGASAALLAAIKALPAGSGPSVQDFIDGLVGVPIITSSTIGAKS